MFPADGVMDLPPEGAAGAGGEAATSPQVLRFRGHLKTLARTPGNLYYESDRNTQDRRSILGW